MSDKKAICSTQQAGKGNRVSAKEIRRKQTHRNMKKYRPKNKRLENQDMIT